MRGLIVLVTVMTTLLFGGLGLLAYGFATKGGSGLPKEMALALPEGADIKLMTAYKDGLALHVASMDGEFIYLYNPPDNAVTGRIAVRKGP